MSATYASRDGHWRVRPVTYTRPGSARVQLLRLEHDSPVVAAHPGAAGHRYGTEQTGPGWWRVDDVRTVAELARWVDLAELELVTGA